MKSNKLALTLYTSAALNGLVLSLPLAIAPNGNVQAQDAATSPATAAVYFGILQSAYTYVGIIPDEVEGFFLTVPTVTVVTSTILSASAGFSSGGSISIASPQSAASAALTEGFFAVGTNDLSGSVGELPDVSPATQTSNLVLMDLSQALSNILE